MVSAKAVPIFSPLCPKGFKAAQCSPGSLKVPIIQWQSCSDFTAHTPALIHFCLQEIFSQHSPQAPHHSPKSCTFEMLLSRKPNQTNKKPHKTPKQNPPTSDNSCWAATKQNLINTVDDHLGLCFPQRLLHLKSLWLSPLPHGSPRSGDFKYLTFSLQNTLTVFTFVHYSLAVTQIKGGCHKFCLWNTAPIPRTAPISFEASCESKVHHQSFAAGYPLPDPKE